jgi:hypothetical protein
MTHQQTILEGKYLYIQASLCALLLSTFPLVHLILVFHLRQAAKKSGELLNLRRNQLRIMTGLRTGYSHLKGHVFKKGLVNSPKCHRCKQASETASRVLGDCEALATLRCRHVDHHTMIPGDFEDIAVSRILHFVQGVGVLNE